MSGVKEGGAATGAIVVDIRYRDAGHAKAIQGALHGEATSEQARIGR